MEDRLVAERLDPAEVVARIRSLGPPKPKVARRGSRTQRRFRRFAPWDPVRKPPPAPKARKAKRKQQAASRRKNR